MAKPGKYCRAKKTCSLLVPIRNFQISHSPFGDERKLKLSGRAKNLHGFSWSNIVIGLYT